MEENVLDVELVDRPISRESKRQDGENSHMLHNGVESLIIIDAGTLHEPVKNSTGLVPLECPVGLELVFEDPLASDNIGVAGGHKTKSQSVV
jgi:hypothetical protein